MKQSRISFNVNDDKMQNKYYNPLAIGLISLDAPLNKDTHTRTLKVKAANKKLRDIGFSKYQIKKFWDCMAQLEILQIDGSECIILPVEKRFVAIPIETVRFCVNTLSSGCFKTYCYLKSWYQLRQIKNYKENYFFSYSEIVRAFGMKKNNVLLKKIREYVNTLNAIGLIECAQTGVYRKGHHGQYIELYQVNDYCPAEIEAIESLDKIIEDEKDIPEDYDPLDVNPEYAALCDGDNSVVKQKTIDAEEHRLPQDTSIRSADFKINWKNGEISFEEYKEWVKKQYLPVYQFKVDMKGKNKKIFEEHENVCQEFLEELRGEFPAGDLHRQWNTQIMGQLSTFNLIWFIILVYFGNASHL